MLVPTLFPLPRHVLHAQECDGPSLIWAGLFALRLPRV